MKKNSFIKQIKPDDWKYLPINFKFMICPIKHIYKKKNYTARKYVVINEYKEFIIPVNDYYKPISQILLLNEKKQN